jgi:hypothetical protein
VGLVICVAALGVSTLGVAGVPDLVNSNADLPAGLPQVSVFLTPDGTGNLMTEARAVTTPPLDVVDATITVTLFDAGMNAVFAYPFEDMWLETTLGGLVACTNGTLANANTDINGVTTFVGPFYAGGYSNKVAGELTQVIINGSPLVGEDLDVLFNSPDLFPDGVVDLSDVSLFSASYGTTDYRANYFYDSAVNLSDLVLFSSSVNVVCP